MHVLLEKMERVIQGIRGLKCERLKNTALIIDDLIFGYIVTAEVIAPYYIQLSIRLTPSLEDVEDRVWNQILEYLLEKSTKFGLALLYDKREKMCAIATKFNCESNNITEMEKNLLSGLDELRGFMSLNGDGILELLQHHRIWVR